MSVKLHQSTSLFSPEHVRNTYERPTVAKHHLHITFVFNYFYTYFKTSGILAGQTTIWGPCSFALVLVLVFYDREQCWLPLQYCSEKPGWCGDAPPGLVSMTAWTQRKWKKLSWPSFSTEEDWHTGENAREKVNIASKYAFFIVETFGQFIMKLYLETDVLWSSWCGHQ